MFNKFFIIMTISALSLYGCGGGDSDTTPSSNTPTNTSLVFSLFTPEYWNEGYSESYSLVGSDTNGDNYTGTQTVTGVVVQNLGFIAYPKALKEITVDTKLTNINTSAPTIMLDKKYFTYGEITDLRLLASENSFGGITTTAINTDNPEDVIIQLEASIGESGTVGNYLRFEDGTTFTISWKLTDGFNGKAKLIVTTVPSNTAIFPTTVEKLLISEDGTVSGYELIITDHQNINTITLTSR